MHQDDTYLGPERRAESRRVSPASLDSIWQLLTDLNNKFEAHIEEEKHIKPSLVELVDILQKSKGVIIFLKFLLYIAAPIAAFVYWIKDHVKL